MLAAEKFQFLFKIAIALISLDYSMYIVRIFFESDLYLSPKDYLIFQIQLDYFE